MQYVPQVVRDSIRNEVKEEVIAQMRAEAWGSGPPSQSVPDWVDRIRFEGDVRVRGQADRFDSNNPPPEEFLAAAFTTGTTRAADLAAGSSSGLPSGNTQDNLNRLRLRARFGLTAKVSDMVSAGLRLATGVITDRVSTNQTLGQNFDRYQFSLDRAFVRLEPLPGAALTLGRMPNPWFATDLQWSENLSFDGIAASYTRRSPGTIEPFATAGWFPIRPSTSSRSGRSLTGLQAGFDWMPSTRARFRFGLAQYAYSGMEGRIDNDYDEVFGPGRTYGQYEYEAGLRQRGNTLFLTNSPLQSAAGLTPNNWLWGLASRFRVQALTMAAELSAFAPTMVMLSAEYARNSAFDRGEILGRTGVTLTDGNAQGFGLRATLGATEVRFRGDWQATLAYRRVGSDAVLDGFTDSDLMLGGTNLVGYTLGFSWGLDNRTYLGMRWLSAHSLESMTVRPSAKDTFGVNSLQLDLNVRF